MKISYWNCRGFRKKNFWLDIKITSQNEHIDVLMLTEIKASNEPEEKWWKGAGFDNICFVPSVGFAGGLCLLWKNSRFINENIQIRFKEERFIMVEHSNPEINFSCNIYLIYAPPNEKSKDEFWNKITDNIKNQNLPCLIMGDFNDILNPMDKKGGSNDNINRYKRLDNIIQKCNLVDVISRGNDFTWRRKKEGENNTLEKLDRALAQFDIMRGITKSTFGITHLQPQIIV